jgi:hypothetical protein
MRKEGGFAISMTIEGQGRTRTTNIRSRANARVMGNDRDD